MTATLPESPPQSYGDAFPNSTKVYLEGSRGIRVPMREIALSGGEPPLRVYDTSGPLGLDAHAYAAYWAGIMRGIEHLVAFRAEAQQIERRTTSLLGQVPGLTRKINDGHLTAEDLSLLDHLAAGLSDIFDSLPEMPWAE